MIDPQTAYISQSAIVSGQNILPYILSISDFFKQKNIKIDPYPVVVISKSTEYITDPFGRTAFYNPMEKSITLFVAGRHIKDVLRSYSHELVHHNQNITGMLDMEAQEDLKDPKYFQKDKTLQKLEADAYLRGNLLFRDWEEQFK
jgi:hypothetical protein